jgi:hypothetical protein
MAQHSSRAAGIGPRYHICVDIGWIPCAVSRGPRLSEQSCPPPPCPPPTPAQAGSSAVYGEPASVDKITHAVVPSEGQKAGL